MTAVIYTGGEPRHTGEVLDPLRDSSWSSADTVAGFAQSSPNPVLMQFAAAEIRSGSGRQALDVGCGAARNAVPLARLGYFVLGTDLSWPMACAAQARARTEQVDERVRVALAPMERLPVADGTIDLIVAHGIWNLAASGRQFRAAVREAARVSRPRAALFVFTFSRNTLPPDATPVDGEKFVFTQFSGQPQCFLTADQLLAELDDAGFAPDSSVPVTEYNRPRPGSLRQGGPPVIYEAAFRYRG
jgi:SAM-dependent methyltransferase